MPGPSGLSPSAERSIISLIQLGSRGSAPDLTASVCHTDFINLGLDFAMPRTPSTHLCSPEPSPPVKYFADLIQPRLNLSDNALTGQKIHHFAKLKTVYRDGLIMQFFAKAPYRSTFIGPDGRRRRYPQSKVPAFKDRAAAEDWAKSQAAVMEAKKAYIALKLSWRSKYYQFDELLEIYGRWQKLKAPNSWQSSVYYLEQSTAQASLSAAWPQLPQSIPLEELGSCLLPGQ